MKESKKNQSEEEKKVQQEKADGFKTSETDSAKQEKGAEKTAETAEKTEKDELKAASEKADALEKENADLKDQLLRRAADFDNYRKRMLKEKQDAFDYANTNLLKDLLDSLDNFDRTLEASEKAADIKAVVEGVKMVSGNLVSMLENKYNLTSFGKAGDGFNPDEHEAIGSAQGPVAEPVLANVFLKGYKLKDRIIRHAKVMVTMPDGSVKAETEKTGDKAADAKADADKK